MADLTSQIRDLQGVFQRIADRAPWVRAIFTVKEGKFGLFSLGRQGGDGRDAPLLEGTRNDQEAALVTELYALTNQASALATELIRSKRYQGKFAALRSSHCVVGEPWGLWLLFLVRNPNLFLNCWAMRPDGKTFALLAIDESEKNAIVSVWIDSYPQLCVSALSWLKADMVAGAGIVVKGATKTTEIGDNDVVGEHEMPPLVAVQTRDLSNLPWGTLRQVSQQFLWAWDDLKTATPEKLSLVQTKTHLALQVLAKVCRKLGILSVKSSGSLQSASATIAGQPFELMLALDLGEAVGSMVSQVNSRHEGIKGAPGYTQIILDPTNPFPFEPGSIDSVRKAAERLPETPLADPPLYRVIGGSGSIPAGQSVKLPVTFPMMNDDDGTKTANGGDVNGIVSASPFDGFGTKTQRLLKYLWDNGRKPRRTIPTVMKELGYTPTSSPGRILAFRTLKYRTNGDLCAMKGTLRYRIDTNKKENTIFLVELVA